jgi:hypothetical protein
LKYNNILKTKLFSTTPTTVTKSSYALACTCRNLISSPSPLAAIFIALIVDGISGIGGADASLIFLRELDALIASEARGEAGNGVVLRGGWRRVSWATAAFRDAFWLVCVLDAEECVGEIEGLVWVGV